MGARQRFMVWVFVVVACLAVAPLRLIQDDGAWVIAGVVQGVGVVVMLLLLGSTGPDAIKLSRETSWSLILSGAWLNLACATPTPTMPVLFAAGVLAVLVPVCVWSTVVPRGDSVWWVVLVSWSPSLPTLVARPVVGESVFVIVISWGLSAAGLLAAIGVVGVVCLREKPVEKGILKRSAWILGITTVMSGFVPLLS